MRNWEKPLASGKIEWLPMSAKLCLAVQRYNFLAKHGLKDLLLLIQTGSENGLK